MPDRADGRLGLLFLLGALLINFPMLAIANQPAMLAGIPVLFLYLFGVWAVGIVAVYWIVRR